MLVWYFPDSGHLHWYIHDTRISKARIGNLLLCSGLWIISASVFCRCSSSHSRIYLILQWAGINGGEMIMISHIRDKWGNTGREFNRHFEGFHMCDRSTIGLPWTCGPCNSCSILVLYVSHHPAGMVSCAFIFVNADAVALESVYLPAFTRFSLLFSFGYPNMQKSNLPRAYRHWFHVLPAFE